jgi:hypothetical protein
LDSVARFVEEVFLNHPIRHEELAFHHKLVGGLEVHLRLRKLVLFCFRLDFLPDSVVVPADAQVTMDWIVSSVELAKVSACELPVVV